AKRSGEHHRKSPFRWTENNQRWNDRSGSRGRIRIPDEKARRSRAVLLHYGTCRRESRPSPRNSWRQKVEKRRLPAHRFRRHHPKQILFGYHTDVHYWRTIRKTKKDL